jgi:rare lipoprotein A
MRIDEAVGNLQRIRSPRPGLCAVRAAALAFILVLFAIQSGATAQNSWSTTVTYCGKASWYGGKFAGKKTANGEIYDPQSMTAAHKTLAFGTRVRITRVNGGKSVIVRINNRGPFIKGRIVDVSEKAAERLGFKSSGITAVCLALLKP